MGATESTRFRLRSSDSVSSRESHVVSMASDTFKANKIVCVTQHA
jgi:hypothetical protein